MNCLSFATWVVAIQVNVANFLRDSEVAGASFDANGMDTVSRIGVNSNAAEANREDDQRLGLAGKARLTMLKLASI